MAKYTDEQMTVINNFAENFTGEIPYEDFTKFLSEFQEEYGEKFKERSLATKIRHMGISLEPKGSVKVAKKYTDEEEAKIADMCSDPDNLPFLEQIADALKRSEKSISGKLVSMSIYGVKKEHLKEAPVKFFDEKDEATINKMCVNVETEDVFIEDIAAALGCEVKKVRGKLAGMRVKGVKTRDKVATKTKIYTDEVVAEIKTSLEAGKTVEEVAEERDLNPRGMLTTLVKLGVIAKKVKAVFWNDERTEQLKTLIADRVTLNDTATAMSTTIMVVGKQAKALGLTFAEPKKED